MLSGTKKCCRGKKREVISLYFSVADNLVVEQVSVNMAAKSEHVAPNTEVISSLVEQLEAPAERDASPESDGSMHGSSGSEALEEALKDAGVVNGQKHENKGGDKQEKGEKKEEKIGKNKKKEDKTIGRCIYIKIGRSKEREE